MKIEFFVIRLLKLFKSNTYCIFLECLCLGFANDTLILRFKTVRLVVKTVIQIKHMTSLYDHGAPRAPLEDKVIKFVKTD